MLKQIAPEIEKKWERGYLDIETASTGDLLDIGFAFGDDYASVDSWLSFFDVCKKLPCKKQQWIAHNGSRFDWINLLQAWLRERDLFEGFEIQKYIVAGRSKLIGMEASLGDKKLRFVDSVSFLQGSLEKVSAGFGVDFKKSEISEKYKENMEMFLGLTSSILVLNLNLFFTRKNHRGIQRGSRNSLGSLSSPRRILRWTPCSLYTSRVR